MLAPGHVEYAHEQHSSYCHSQTIGPGRILSPHLEIPGCSHGHSTQRDPHLVYLACCSVCHVVVFRAQPGWALTALALCVLAVDLTRELALYWCQGSLPLL